MQRFNEVLRRKVWGVKTPNLRKRALQTNTALALTVVASIALVAPASAKRPATQPELQAVAAVFEDTPRCAMVTISTVDASYARWQHRRPYPEGCVDDFPGFGIARLQGDGTWRPVFFGDVMVHCSVAKLPVGAGMDLGACTDRIYARNTVGDDLATAYKPRRIIQGAHGVFQRLRWSWWSSKSAMARGQFDYSDAYVQFRVPVTIKLSRPVEN